MVEISINEKSCYGLDCCSSGVCEEAIPGIQRYVKEHGVLFFSPTNYIINKDRIDKAVNFCPASAVAVVNG